MKNKHLISIKDLTKEEIFEIIDKTFEIKKEQNKIKHLEGKTLGMIFQKASTRTRVSFEVGMYQLGGYALYLNASDLQIGRGETVGDTAQTLSRYVDGIMIRTFDHNEPILLAKYGSVPVINGLTDLCHPCQILSDIVTIIEKKGRIENLKISFIGDINNVANSWIYAACKLDFELEIVTSGKIKPIDEVYNYANENKANLKIITEPEKGAIDADVIYTDVWASMGQEKEREERIKIFKPFQVNSEFLKKAKPDCIVMHCLPAHRGEEITDEVIDGKNSVVFDEAENRLHTQKAIMVLLMK